MHLCFGQPSMIRGFNNHNLSHKSLKDGALGFFRPAYQINFVPVFTGFITSVMDTNERRDVATVDIPWSFLQTKVSDETLIKLQGAIVASLLKINPSGNKMRYMKDTSKSPPYIVKP